VIALIVAVIVLNSREEVGRQTKGGGD